MDILAVLALAAAAVGVTAALWWRRRRQRASQLAVQAVAGLSVAVLVDPAARLVAASSTGRLSWPSTGTLALGTTRLVYVSANRHHRIAVERAHISNVAVARSHLGVDAGRALVVVEWDHDTCAGSAAWIVTDPPRWLTTVREP